MKAAEVAVSDLQRDKSILEGKLRQLRQQHALLLEQHEYEAAKKCWDEIHETVEKDRELIRQHELQRQKMEFNRLKQATNMIVDRSKEEWEVVLQHGERRWEHKRHALQEKHKLEMEKYIQQFDSRAKEKHLGRSTQVRDLVRIEKRLAEGHEYEEAKSLYRILQKVDNEEREAKKKSWEELRAQHIDRLEKKQQEEANYLEMQIKNERIMLTRKSNEAKNIIFRRLENQKADMVHAHLTELHPKRVSGNSVSMPPIQLKRHQEKSEERLKSGFPHGCSPGRMATYRGSQMLNRTQGKYPLLSLCALYDPDVTTLLHSSSVRGMGGAADGTVTTSSSPHTWSTNRSFADLKSPEFMTMKEKPPSRKAKLLFARTVG